ncbi:DUF1772 domain-containing protein [Planotetraspora kaengkrachanensis]|nr:DUF1772 domain-containing protein [Planotetraspora kaengkrachanensis]
MRTHVRYVQGAALLATGLLAGAFGYGAANVVPTFAAVPLEVRLTFHTAMMKVNEPVMQAAMALAILSSFGLAVVSHGLSRRLAIGAGALTLTSLLVTVFGNVPLHAHIRRWAATSVTEGYAEILQRWETFHYLRTMTGLAAFAVIIIIVVFTRPESWVVEPLPPTPVNGPGERASGNRR